jgi:hypothetical protein
MKGLTGNGRKKIKDTQVGPGCSGQAAKPTAYGSLSVIVTVTC